jgi:hypothetical protein
MADLLEDVEDTLCPKRNREEVLVIGKEVA